MTTDKPMRMGFLIAGIPAKPLSQAKLKSGGILLPGNLQGGWRGACKPTTALASHFL